MLTARIQITGLLLSQKPGVGTYTGILPETAAGTVWLAQLGRRAALAVRNARLGSPLGT